MMVKSGSALQPALTHYNQIPLPHTKQFLLFSALTSFISGSEKMAIMIAIAAEAMRPAAAATSLALVARPSPRAKWSFGPLHVRAFSSSQEQSTSRKLVLYTKPGCCLCEGLKEKLQAAFFLGGPDSLSDVQLQIRDISTNSEWEKSYQYEIPVLARILSDGTEETLPRLSPRLGIELIQKKIAAALKE